MAKNTKKRELTFELFDELKQLDMDILNEQQATLLITYLRNTEPVKEFKKNLVKAFFEMRDELSKRYLQR